MGLGGLKLVVAAFFVYAAVVQVNDPDALLWMLMYAVAATLTVMSLVITYHAAFTGSFAAICICWAILILPTAFDKDLSFAEEIPRELFGLLIVSAWMLWLTIHHRYRRRDAEVSNYPLKPNTRR